MIRLFLIISKKYFNRSFPERLKWNGRNKVPVSNFNSTDKLYRSYKKTDLDETKHLKLETIKFPDISCNWDKFSEPEDVWFRSKGTAKDGCYSITVEDARFNKIANTVHDPIPADDEQYMENYSHVEVRLLPEGKDFTFEPPKGKSLNSKMKKREYRHHIQENYKIEIKAL